MKRLVTMILLIGLLLTGCGTVEQTEHKGQILFYYSSVDPYAKEGFIAVDSQLEGKLTLSTMIREYFSAETPEGALPVIPQGWSFDSHGFQTDGVLILNFSGRGIPAVEESLALATMTRTFSQLSSVRRVRISTPGNHPPLTLSVNDVLLEDMAMFPQEELVLYLPDEDLRYLRREIRIVDSVAEEDKAMRILQLLLEEEDGEPHSIFPRGTKLLKAQVENGVCTVDLSSEFVRNMPQRYGAVRLAVYSIVNSLTELKGIRMVDFQIAHGTIDRIYDLDMSRGFSWEEDLLYGDGGYDGSIYPYAKDSELLVEVPLWLREEPNRSREEQLMTALLNYRGDDLVGHSIPDGTSLLSVRMAEDTCVVDLTAEFIDRAEGYRSQVLAVRSIVATLSTLPYVKAVEILVEGNRPQYYTNRLREVRTTVPEWFAE
jgi:germination protein M